MKIFLSRCELSNNPRKKEAANAKAASIAEQFPHGMAKPALRALYVHGIRQLGDLRNLREDELASLHGIGPKALLTLRKAMRKQGLSFRRPV